MLADPTHRTGELDDLFDPTHRMSELDGLLDPTRTTRKHKFNDGGIPREFVVKEALRGISEETRFVVTRSS